MRRARAGVGFRGHRGSPVAVNLFATFAGRLVRTERCPSADGDCFALAKRAGGPTLAPGESFACLYQTDKQCASVALGLGGRVSTVRKLGCDVREDGGSCCGIKLPRGEIVVTTTLTEQGMIGEFLGMMCSVRDSGQ